jgi:hypothetical protein
MEKERMNNPEVINQLDKIANMSKIHAVNDDFPRMSTIDAGDVWDALPKRIKLIISPQDFADIYETWFNVALEYHVFRQAETARIARKQRLAEFVVIKAREALRDVRDKIDLSRATTTAERDAWYDEDEATEATDEATTSGVDTWGEWDVEVKPPKDGKHEK